VALTNVHLRWLSLVNCTRPLIVELDGGFTTPSKRIIGCPGCSASSVDPVTRNFASSLRNSSVTPSCSKIDVSSLFTMSADWLYAMKVKYMSLAGTLNDHAHL
jgi:hypothetical protein